MYSSPSYKYNQTKKCERGEEEYQRRVGGLIRGVTIRIWTVVEEDTGVIGAVCKILFIHQIIKNNKQTLRRRKRMKRKKKISKKDTVVEPDERGVTRVHAGLSR